jgi:hypothetical protein
MPVFGLLYLFASERGYGRAGHEPADPLAAALFGMRRSPPAGVVVPEGIGALLEESILTFKVAKSARARLFMVFCSCMLQHMRKSSNPRTGNMVGDKRGFAGTHLDNRYPAPIVGRIVR